MNLLNVCAQPMLSRLCLNILPLLAGCSLYTVAAVAQAATPLPSMTVSKIQIAQVHVLHSRFGRTWTQPDGTKLTYRALPNRPAVIIVDAELNGATAPQLQIDLGLKTLGVLPLSQDFAALSSEDPTVPFGFKANSWYAVVPANLMQKGISVRIKALYNNQVNRSVKQTVHMAAPVDFNMYTLPYYLFGANDNTLPFDTAKNAPITAQQELYAKWPITTLHMQNHNARRVDWPYVIVAPRNGQAAYRVNTPSEKQDGFAIMDSVLASLRSIRNANGDQATNNQYYAPIIQADPAGKFVSVGGGLGGGHVGTGDHLYAGIFIHEQGHAFGMPHAGESYRANSGYPYIGGSLNGSLWGFDQNKMQFLPTVVPSTASSYNRCKTQVFDGTPRQIDRFGRCIKQDSMQSGSGDQGSAYRYTMHSDYNAAVIQRYFEGSTTLVNGTKRYSGGRIFPRSEMPSGYARWDAIDQAWVNFDPAVDSNKGLYGVNQNFPTQKNTAVYTIVLTISKAGTAGATQIYPAIGPYQGNLIKTFDPTVSQDRLDMTPNVSSYPWYCRNSGCDYTVKVTYSNGSTRHVALHGGFRPWFGEESAFSENATNPTHSNSFKVFAINVPATTTISKVELLDTPTVWKGMSLQPAVLASR